MHINQTSNLAPLLILISSMLFLSNCNDEEPEAGLPDLRVYLDRFEDEAALRGYDFDLSEVEIEYVDIIEADHIVCGRGYSDYEGTGKRRIEMSTAGHCKRVDKYTDLELESFVFHEIGHAFLDRNHTELLLCDGSAMSIMYPEPWTLYSGDNKDKRSYYISELLDGSIEEKCVDWKSNWENDTSYYQYDSEDYWFFVNRGEDFVGTREGDIISIELAPDSTSDQTGNFLTTIYTDLQDCANVTFKATINSEGLVGNGAAISLRVFERDQVTEFGAPNSEYETLYLTTGDQPASGELIDHQEELTIQCLSRDTWFIVLFVRLLPETEGKVTFSDIRLIVNE